MQVHTKWAWHEFLVGLCVLMCAGKQWLWLIWPWVALSGLFLPLTECCWFCKHRQMYPTGLPPCSSPMPQTNEFLKTASIKLQARSIDHRVDFVSTAEKGFWYKHCFHCQATSTLSLQPSSTVTKAVNQEYSNRTKAALSSNRILLKSLSAYDGRVSSTQYCLSGNMVN